MKDFRWDRLVLWIAAVGVVGWSTFAVYLVVVDLDPAPTSDPVVVQVVVRSTYNGFLSAHCVSATPVRVPEYPPIKICGLMLERGDTTTLVFDGVRWRIPDPAEAFDQLRPNRKP